MDERVEEIILRETEVFRIVVKGVGGNFGLRGGGGRCRIIGPCSEEVEGTLGVEEMREYPGLEGLPYTSLQEMPGRPLHFSGGRIGNVVSTGDPIFLMLVYI